MEWPMYFFTEWKWTEGGSCDGTCWNLGYSASSFHVNICKWTLVLIALCKIHTEITYLDQITFGADLGSSFTDIT